MIWLQQPPGGVFRTTEEIEEYEKYPEKQNIIEKLKAFFERLFGIG